MIRQSGGNYGNLTPGPYDISADPRFVDAANGDFHLQADSPCIDAGDPNNYPETDFEGDPRPIGVAPDIGADEFRASNPISRTATDYSHLEWDAPTRTYTRVYPDGTQVHFNPDGTHDYTLDPVGNKLVYTYNADGSVVTMTFIQAGSSGAQAASVLANSPTTYVWGFDYSSGRLSGITDPAGRTSAFEVDGQGNLLRMGFPDGSERRFTYDARGLMTQQQRDANEITTFVYDGLGRVKSVSMPQRTMFDSATGQTQVAQETRLFTASDTAYRLINDSPIGSPAAPAPSVPRTEDLLDKVAFGVGERSGQTNKWGSWTAMTDGLGRTTHYTRDTADNVTKRTQPDGSCVETAWDDRGSQTMEARMGADQCALPPGQRDPSKVKIWTYTYIEYQSLTDYRIQRYKRKTETDPLGKTTTYVYDFELGIGEQGNLMRIVYPAVQDENGNTVQPTVSYTYDSAGRTLTETDERGIVTKYVYTQGTSDEAPGGANPLFLPGAVLRAGLLTQQIEDYGDASHLNITTVYRDFTVTGRPATEIFPGCCGQPQVVRYTYNVWGCVETMIDPLGIVTKYEYNNKGHLIKQIEDYTADGVTGRNVVTEYTVDPHGQVLAERTTADGVVWQTTKTYDVNRNLATQSDSYGGTAVYAYDRENRLTRVNDPLGRITSYTYTLADKQETLTEPDGGVTHYSYDAFGNRTQEVVDQGGLSLTTSFVYDLNDNLLRVTDPNGTVTCHAYDALGRRTSETRDCDGLNLTTTYVYDLADNLVRVVDARGVVTLNTYDALGRRLSTRSDANGLNLLTSYVYDEADNLIQATSARGIVTTHQYDTMNRLTRTCQDAAGLNLCATYTYDSLGNRITQTAPNGVTTRTDYNAFGQPIRVVSDQGGLNSTVSQVYDNNLNRIATANPNGHTTRYAYDAGNQLVRTTDPLGHVTTATYNLRGQPASAVDQDGIVTHYEYDRAGRRTREIVNPGGLNLVSQYTYDTNGNLLNTTDPTGTATCRTYDRLNRLTRETRDCGGLDLSATYAYDEADNLVATTDERGVVTRNEYDALNRMVRTRRDAEGLNLTISYEHDAVGNVIRTTDERGTVTASTFDAVNRATRVCQDATGLNLCTATTYDQVGNPLTVTDPRGVKSRTTYNALNRPLSQIEDDGGLSATTSYAYDAALNLTRLTDANGHATMYVYDAQGQLVETRFADGTRITNAYNPDGTLASRTDQAGARTDFVYDAANRLLRKSYPGGSQQSFAYDPAGRMLSANQTMSGHTTQAHFTYNAPGDLTSEVLTVDGRNWTTAYAYNYSAGRRTITYPSGAQIERGLDALRRLAQVKRGGASLATYTYNDANGTVSLGHANGVTTVIETDRLRRATRVSSAVADYRYGYDGGSNRTYMQRWHKPGQPADVYQYDGLNQLTQVWYGANATAPGAISGYERLQRYQLDDLGNRLEVQNNGLSEVYLPNNGQQLTNIMNRYEQVGASLLGYDAKGNVLNDGVNTYTYDFENRQITASGPGGSAQYVYDALGRRVAKLVGGNTTYYVYDDVHQVIEERDAASALAARYIYGAGVDAPLTMERSGATYTYLRDALGSVTEVTDSGGTLIERYEYDVFGAPRIFDSAGNPLSASAIGNPYLFTGRRYDPESGNYDYRARVYRPAIGRFLQMDPAGYVDGMNLYAYVNNSPVDLVDPSGQKSTAQLACEARARSMALYNTEAYQHAMLAQDARNRAMALYSGYRGMAYQAVMRAQDMYNGPRGQAYQAVMRAQEMYGGLRGQAYQAVMRAQDMYNGPTGQAYQAVMRAQDMYNGPIGQAFQDFMRAQDMDAQRASAGLNQPNSDIVEVSEHEMAAEVEKRIRETDRRILDDPLSPFTAWGGHDTTWGQGENKGRLFRFRGEVFYGVELNYYAWGAYWSRNTLGIFGLSEFFAFHTSWIFQLVSNRRITERKLTAADMGSKHYR